MTTRRRLTFAQKGSILIGIEFIALGIAGLIVNPDFGTGSHATAKVFLVDWNGWHATATLLLAAGSLLAAARPVWAIAYQAYNAFALTATAVWAGFDSKPAGLLDFRHASTDIVLHLVTAALAATIVVVQLRRDRTGRVLTAS